MLSVVIPAHNESANLPGLIREIGAALDSMVEYEIVVVDDGSSDSTVEVLAEESKELPRLRLVRHQQSCGQSTALMTGIDEARYATIATLDGDGQNDPADIPTMLKLQQNQQKPELTMIVGHRQKRKDSGWRLFCSKVANSVRAGLLGDATPDSGCGIKVFSKSAFQRFPRFDHMHRFLPALMRRLGGEVISTPVNHRQRANGSSHYGTLGRLTAGVIDLIGVAWLKHRTKIPVKVDNQKKESSGK